MSRVKGGLFTATLDVSKRFPLDSRMLVTKREDLINPKTWITNTLSTEATYNGMIVSVNSDGEYNGVYYLRDRKAITADNYSAYQAALKASEDVNPYFSMWTKLGTLDDITKIKPVTNLVPVDGTIVVTNNEDGCKAIGVAIAPVDGNALIAVDGGLFVPTTTIKVADNAHGLVAVDGVLTLNLATKDSDGAMSKEDKMALDELKDSVSRLNNTCTWGEM